MDREKKSADRLGDLSARMARRGILKHDLEEHFVRSSGKGGQNVNKVSTCVHLRHLPSGVHVKCQEHRTQQANRLAARRLLMQRVLQIRQEKKLKDKMRAAKLRRQRRRRSPQAKERVLEEKKKRSQMKQSRRRIRTDTGDEG